MQIQASSRRPDSEGISSAGCGGQRLPSPGGAGQIHDRGRYSIKLSQHKKQQQFVKKEREGGGRGGGGGGGGAGGGGERGRGGDELSAVAIDFA